MNIYKNSLPQGASSVKRPDCGLLMRVSKQPLQDLAVLTAKVCHTPIASICLLSSDQQWFTYQIGVDALELSSLYSFSTHTMLQPGLVMINDQLIGSVPDFRFYAGIPLRNTHELTFGTLCVFDRAPRTFNQEEQDALRTLGNQVLAQLELEHQRDQEEVLLARLSDKEATVEEQSRLIEEHKTECQRLTAKLVQETKLAEITRALGDIGHDTKNMLMPVLSGIELLQEELQEHVDLLAPRGQERVEASRKVIMDIFEMVTKNSHRIQDRVREIADAVKGVTTPLNFQPCQMSNIIDSVIQALQTNAIKKRVTLHAQGLDHLPAIPADTRRLFTAFYNLLDNAIPEVPPGGSVTVHGAIDLSTHQLVLSVTDTGKGMSPEQCSRLFTEHTVSRKARGTGLGTKIIKDAIDSHNGSIVVNSREGVGTTFHIRLPLHRTHQVSVEQSVHQPFHFIQKENRYADIYV